jgi:hypothetical protein
MRRLAAARFWLGTISLVGAVGCGGQSHQTVTVASHMPLYAGMQGHVAVSSQQAAAIARNTRLIVATRRQLEGLAPAITAADPATRIEVYVNAMFVHPDQGSTFPHSWYLYDRSGAQVRSRFRGNYLMNADSSTPYQGVAGWSAWVARSCRAALGAIPAAQGCFLDMIGPAPLRPGYDAGGAVPVDPATGAAFRPARYLALTGALAAVVEHVSGHGVIANGLESGLHAEKVPTRILLPYAGGFEIEHWMGVGDTQARSIQGWVANVQLVIDLSRAHKLTLVNFQTPATAAAEQWRAFALASFLLAAGNDQFLQIEPAAHGGPSWGDPSPLYAADLGRPLDSSATVDGYRHGGLYSRRYQHGMVLVNPGATTAPFTIPSGYVPAAGGSAPSAEIPARTGLILVRHG